MSDPFASGTPWDEGDPIAGDFTAEPIRKVELAGPIFQVKGQRAVKMKLPKAPKAKRDPDDILGERTSRVIWAVMRWQRTVAVILFLATVSVFTYSLFVGSSGKPWKVTFPAPLLHFLGISAGSHIITPVLAAALAIIVPWMVAAIIGLAITKPHGKFRRFTVHALIFAGVGVAVDLAAGGVLTHVVHHLIDTAPSHLGSKWAWLVDPSATPDSTSGVPNTPTPTPTAPKP